MGPVDRALPLAVRPPPNKAASSTTCAAPSPSWPSPRPRWPWSTGRGTPWRCTTGR